MESSDGAARVVLSTAPEGEAARIARGLVEAGLAACVNLAAGVTSVYAWKGAIHEDRETLMVIKTSLARLPELEALLLRLHPYEVPEVVVLVPAQVEARYLAWLLAATEASGPGRP